MIGEGQLSGWRILFSILVGLALAIVPLPHFLDVARPDWLLIFVIYWSLTTPRMAGLAFAWICGFAVDILHGIVLGEHALAFLIVGYMTHRVQLRMRIYPVWQQAFTVFLMLTLYQFCVFWIDGLVGEAVFTWMRWLPVLSGALLWPLTVAIMDTLNRRRR